MAIIDGITECVGLSSTCRIDWTAWAAIGAILAAGAAVYAARTSIKNLYRQRTLDREDAQSVAAARAKMVSMVLDMDLYLFGGEVRNIVESLHDDRWREDPFHAAREIAAAHRELRVGNLERFAPYYVDFGPSHGAALHQVLATHHAISMHFAEGVERLVRDRSAKEVADTLESHCSALEIYLDHIRVARSITLVRGGLQGGHRPETDF